LSRRTLLSVVGWLVGWLVRILITTLRVVSLWQWCYPCCWRYGCPI